MTSRPTSVIPSPAPPSATAGSPATSRPETSNDRFAFMQQQYPNAEIITDVASGLNYRRKGLATILERLQLGDKLTLVVAYRDRLARFGTELIEQMLQQNGGELLVLNQRDLSPPEELTQDLLAILTVFSARANGLRKVPQENPGRSESAQTGNRGPSLNSGSTPPGSPTTTPSNSSPPTAPPKPLGSCHQEGYPHQSCPSGQSPSPTRSRATQSGTPAWQSARSRSSTSS